MPLFKATPARRRQMMIVLLVLATGGALVRHFAPDPSTLRDIGTLLLVLWLPAVGNLVAYLLRKIPRSPPVPVDFPAGSAFVPHLGVRLQALQPVADRSTSRCTLVVDRRGFTARMAQPVALALDQAEGAASLQLLQPRLALREFRPGTGFHLLVGATAVASGVVLTQAGAAPAPASMA